MLLNDFNLNLNRKYNTTNIVSLSEVQLFRTLVDTLISYNGIHASVMHQRYCYFDNNCKSIKRELCDVLVVIKKNGIIRFSFVQHKKIKDLNYKGLGDFNVDCGQHYLLVKKPIININGVTTNILKNHNYKTITTYSVFYQDNQNINFDLASAKDCVTCCKNTFYLNIRKKICSSNHLDKYITCIIEKPKLIDYIALKNANDIEKYPFFGEVIDNTIKLEELLKIIRTFNLNIDDIKKFFGSSIQDIKTNFYNDEKINYEKFLDFKDYIISDILLINCDENIEDKNRRK